MAKSVACNEHRYSVNFLLIPKVLQFLFNKVYSVFITCASLHNSQICPRLCHFVAHAAKLIPMGLCVIYGGNNHSGQGKQVLYCRISVVKKIVCHLKEGLPSLLLFQGKI